MEKRFYLDTSIWRDYFEDRKDGIRPLGEFAFRLLQKCLEKKITVIVSNIVVLELEEYYSKERIKLLFSPFEEIIMHVWATHEQTVTAKQEWLKLRNRLPPADVLHAVIAKDYKAILVARDKHFEILKGLVEVYFPEEAIQI